MGTVLVVYGSWAGSTAGVAHRVGEALTRCGANVRVLPASSAPDPAGYDAVVVGSAVRSGAWHPVVMSWIASHAGKLSVKPTALFTVCLTPAAHPGRLSQARGYTLPVTMATGSQPVGVGLFAGTYNPDQHAFKERTVASLWGAKRGDYRDWPAIEAWATQVAPRLDGGGVRDAFTWTGAPLR